MRTRDKKKEVACIKTTVSPVTKRQNTSTWHTCDRICVYLTSSCICLQTLQLVGLKWYTHKVVVWWVGFFLPTGEIKPLASGSGKRPVWPVTGKNRPNSNSKPKTKVQPFFTGSRPVRPVNWSGLRGNRGVEQKNRRKTHFSSKFECLYNMF